MPNEEVVRKLTVEQVREVVDYLVDTALSANANVENIELLLKKINFEESFGPMFMNMGNADYQNSLPMWKLLREIGQKVEALGKYVKELPEEKRRVLLGLVLSRGKCAEAEFEEMLIKGKGNGKS